MFIQHTDATNILMKHAIRYSRFLENLVLHWERNLVNAQEGFNGSQIQISKFMFANLSVLSQCSLHKWIVFGKQSS